MGTQGASGLKEVFIGSVAGGVISKTTAPVIVVPHNYINRRPNEVDLAISGRPFSSKSVFDPLRKIKKICPCKIRVLHIAENEEPQLDAALSTIEDLNATTTYTFGTGNVNHRLSEFLLKEDVDLLCLVRGKKDFFDRLFKESVTLKQTFNSPIPLLILHD
jgi:hypothetical protein